MNSMLEGHGNSRPTFFNVGATTQRGLRSLRHHTTRGSGFPQAANDHRQNGGQRPPAKVEMRNWDDPLKTAAHPLMAKRAAPPNRALL